MAISSSMQNAIVTIEDKCNLNLILERDYKFEYGCSVNVTRGEQVWLESPPKESYSKEISVNEEILKLLGEIDRLKQTK